MRERSKLASRLKLLDRLAKGIDGSDSEWFYIEYFSDEEYIEYFS